MGSFDTSSMDEQSIWSHEGDATPRGLTIDLTELPVGAAPEIVDKVTAKLFDEHCKGDMDAASQLFSNFAQEQEKEKAEEELDEEEEKERQLWASLEAQKFKFGTGGAAGNPMAGRWARWLKENAEQKALYEKEKGRAAKEESRRRWYQQKFDEYREQRSFTTTSSERQLKEARYYSLERIAVEEGGGKAGFRAACNYAVRAVKVGGKFYKWNSWTQTVKFLYVTEGEEESLEKAWATTKSWTLNSSPKPAAQQAPAASLALEAATTSEAKVPPQAPAVASAARGDDEGLAKASANAKTKAKAKPKAATPNKRKSELTEAMTQAKKVKTELSATLSQAANLLASIDKDANWSWASRASVSGSLVSDYKDIKDLLDRDEFAREILSAPEMASLKQGRQESELATLLHQFRKAFQAKVDALGKECRMLNAQQKARLSS